MKIVEQFCTLLLGVRSTISKKGQIMTAWSKCNIRNCMDEYSSLLGLVINGILKIM
jgi:hypothetical protein